MAANNAAPDLEAALAAASERGDHAGFLRILAVGTVVLPQLRPLDQAGDLRLPVVERDGVRYILAFTSQRRLADSEVEAAETVSATGRQLGASWPTDEDLWLAINPGSELGVALPPDAVRALAATATDS